MGLNVDVLESSFQLVAPKGSELVARFYERLFEKYPQVKPMFKNVDIEKQQEMLLGALVLVVNNLRNPEALSSALKSLGAKHLGYGAEAGHYDAVKENLLAVLSEFAGDAWTMTVETAWAEALVAISGIMLEGASEAKETETKTKASRSTMRSKKAGSGPSPAP